ncbi:hypothetical protein C8R43DRAFT_442350 [Mycena crocata]|nr:hypothetical protein C8R43DRAFT_442350 [Mycena crocata]
MLNRYVVRAMLVVLWIQLSGSLLRILSDIFLLADGATSPRYSRRTGTGCHSHLGNLCVVSLFFFWLTRAYCTISTISSVMGDTRFFSMCSKNALIQKEIYRSPRSTKI